MVKEIACVLFVETDVIRAEIPTKIKELAHMNELYGINAPLHLLEKAQNEKRTIKYMHNWGE